MVRRVGKERKTPKNESTFTKNESGILWHHLPHFSKNRLTFTSAHQHPILWHHKHPKPQKTSQLSKNESGVQKRRVSYFMTSQTPLFRKPIHFYLWAQDPILWHHPHFWKNDSWVAMEFSENFKNRLRYFSENSGGQTWVVYYWLSFQNPQTLSTIEW